MNVVPGKSVIPVKTNLPVSLVCWWWPRACLHQGIIFSEWRVTNNCEQTSFCVASLWIMTPLTASRHRDSWQERAERSEIGEWSREGWAAGVRLMLIYARFTWFLLNAEYRARSEQQTTTENINQTCVLTNILSLNNSGHTWASSKRYLSNKFFV